MELAKRDGIAIGVIPVRFGANRLPGKPLKDIGGKTLVQRVWEQACKSSELNKVIVATEDERIAKAAEELGAVVEMTSSSHLSGTDRVAEVTRKLIKEGTKISSVTNIQGDLPFINPAAIDTVVKDLESTDGTVGVATVATPITEEEEFNNPNAVKVVRDVERKALYFSRAPIPYRRERAPGQANPLGFKHLGLYVFRPWALETFTNLPQSNLEYTEGLEQLRLLQSDVPILVTTVARALLEPAIEVDTSEDLERAQSYAEQMASSTPSSPGSSACRQTS